MKKIYIIVFISEDGTTQIFSAHKTREGAEKYKRDVLWDNPELNWKYTIVETELLD